MRQVENLDQKTAVAIATDGLPVGGRLMLMVGLALLSWAVVLLGFSLL